MLEVVSIQLGYSALRFEEDDASELVMRSGWMRRQSAVDLPNLTTLLFSALTFDLPHHITLESDLSLLKSSVDMPKLANAHLPANAFQYKDDVIIKGGFSFRSVLCLDVGVFASYFSSYSVFSKHDCVTVMIMFHPSSILNAIYTLENWSCMLQEAITLH